MEHITIEKKLHAATLFLRVYTNQFSQKIIKLLESEGELSVTETYVRLRQEQAVTSQHYALLRKHKIVKFRRDGQRILYSLDKTHYKKVAHLAAFWTIK